jgi:hypothetical protein
MFRAYFDSRHFSFEAYGSTREKAISALKKGLRSHGRTYGDRITPNWWKEYECDIFAYEINLNHAYRDRSEIT